MTRPIAASAAALLTLALAAPVFACGGSHAGKTEASAASVGSSCSSHASATAWAGAWLQRDDQGRVTVAEVAKGSPAQKAGMRAGDVVTAVNGKSLSKACSSAQSASSTECKEGRSVTFTVQRGNSTRSLSMRLEKLPADAATRFASRRASFEPALASLVMPAAY